MNADQTAAEIIAPQKKPSLWKKIKKLSGKKKLLLVAGLCLIFICFYMFFGNKNNADLMVLSVPVTRGDLEVSINLKAPLTGTESAEVVSRLHYEVTDLMVQEGDRVQKNQILAVLDSGRLLAMYLDTCILCPI